MNRRRHPKLPAVGQMLSSALARRARRGGKRAIVMSEDANQLLRLGREALDVPELSDLNEIEQWLRNLGARDVDIDVSGFMDEHVDRDLVVATLTILDADLMRRRALPEEIDRLEWDEPFDPLEYGQENEAETRFAHELAFPRLLIFLERMPDDDTRLGNYRVYGPGQWLRDSLWAATGVVPRDTANSENDLFGDACVLEGRARFASKPIPGWQPLP